MLPASYHAIMSDWQASKLLLVCPFPNAHPLRGMNGEEKEGIYIQGESKNDEVEKEGRALKITFKQQCISD